MFLLKLHTATFTSGCVFMVLLGYRKVVNMKQEDYCISLGQAEGSNGDGRYSESQTFCSEHFHPSRFTRPSFPYFGQDLGTRLGVRTENEANGMP